MLTLAALQLWRTIDGIGSLRQLAVTIGKPVAETVAAAQELLDNGLAEFATLAVADPRFVREVARETVDLMGPVGSIVVEDALMDLGLVPTRCRSARSVSSWKRSDAPSSRASAAPSSRGASRSCVGSSRSTSRLAAH